MNDRRFRREISRQLNNRLVDCSEYVVSRRIEGMLELNDDTKAPEKADIILDCEVSEEDANAILNTLFDVLRRDNNYGYTRFRFLKLINGTLEKCIPSVNLTFAKAAYYKSRLSEIVYSNEGSGSLEEFEDIAHKLRSVPLVIFITTEDKVKHFDELKLRIRNFVVIYASPEEKRTITIKGMPCIAYHKEEEPVQEEKVIVEENVKEEK